MKKIVSLFVAFVLLCSGISVSVHGSDLVLRTYLEQNFDAVDIDTVPSPFTKSVKPSAFNGVKEFDGSGRAMYFNTDGTREKTDNRIDWTRNFSGEWKISFRLYTVKCASFLIAFKDNTNSKWINWLKIMGETPYKNNTAVAGKSFAKESWHDVRLEINSADNTYKTFVDDELYISGTAPSGFDYSNVTLRLQAYATSVGDATEVYLDDIAALKYDERPSITLIGAAETEHTLGTVYTDPGCTASDPVDGDITSKVLVSGTVDTETEGTYYLDYNVTANDSTAAQTVTRTVIVRKKRLTEKAAVSASSQIGGNAPQNAIDGNEDTYWQGEGENQYLSLTFPDNTLMDSIRIKGSHTPSDVQLLHTADGEKWSKINAAASRNGEWLTLSFNPVPGGTYNLYFSDTDTVVYELECDISDNGVVNAELDAISEYMKSIALPLTGNITLNAVGAYGAAVLWTSSDESIITSSGKVNFPDKAAEVTLSAAVTYRTAHAEKSFGPYTVVSNTRGLRHKLEENMENININSTPSYFTEHRYANGGSAGVKSIGSGKALNFSADCTSEASADAYVGAALASAKNLRYSFRVMAEKAGSLFQLVIKDNTSGTIKSLFTMTKDVIRAYNKNCSAPEEGKWYSVVIDLNTENGEITIFLDGSEVCSKQLLAGEGNNWDYGNSTIRFQAYNSANGVSISYYMDDFNIYYLNQLPEITLIGDEVYEMYVGDVYSEPGFKAEDALDGDLTKDVVTESDLNTSVPGTYSIKYTVSASDGTLSNTVTRTVIVKDANLFKSAKLSSDNDGIERITDDNSQTAFDCPDGGSFTAEFSKPVIIDRFVFDQKGLGITNINLYSSQNGKDWTALDAAFENNGSRIILTIAPAPFTHVKCVFGGTGISVTEASCLAEKENVVSADKNHISLPDTVTNGDIVLVKNGEYGSKITWSSDNVSVISNNGTVVIPSNDTVVTMTACVSFMGYSENREFKITVKGSGKKNQTTGGGGGAGGGGYKPSTAAAVTDVIPDADVPQKKYFSDVLKTHWAYDYINSLYEKGIVSGTDKNTFEPDRAVTREEFLKLLLNGLNIPEVTGENVFADVDGSAWYCPYVITGISTGIINGVSGTAFGTGLYVSRQDMAVMAKRALDYIGFAAKGDGAVSAKDAGEIADYALNSVSVLYNLHITGGDDFGNFNPRGELTRAEAAKVISVICDLISGGAA